MLKVIWLKIKEIFEPDVTAEIKERITNPLYISILVSWLVWNWELIFILFNFDASANLDVRISRIQDYLNNHDKMGSLIFCPILTAFASIFIFSVLIQFSLVIVVFFRRKIQPVIYKYVGAKQDIVDKETHIEIKNRLYKLQARFKDMQEISSKSSEEVSTLKAELNNELAQNSILKGDKSILQNEIQRLKNKHSVDWLFTGTFDCEYITDKGEYGKETAIIRDNVYMINGKPVFKLDMIDINDNDIKFRKVGVNLKKDNRKLINELVNVNDYEISGTENGNYLIWYIKSDLPLYFRPYFTKAKVSKGEMSSIVFSFRNRINTDIDILSYQFVSIFNGNEFKIHPEKEYLKEVKSQATLNEEFGLVDPLVEYFMSQYEPGIYDAKITIKYRVREKVEEHFVTRIARLIVH